MSYKQKGGSYTSYDPDKADEDFRRQVKEADDYERRPKLERISDLERQLGNPEIWREGVKYENLPIKIRDALTEYHRLKYELAGIPSYEWELKFSGMKKKKHIKKKKPKGSKKKGQSKKGNSKKGSKGSKKKAKKVAEQSGGKSRKPKKAKQTRRKPKRSRLSRRSRLAGYNPYPIE